MEISKPSSYPNAWSDAITPALVIGGLTCLVAWARAKKASMEHAANSPIFEGIPIAPGGHWLLGHLVIMNKDGDFRTGQKEVVVKNADEHGMCSIWFLSKPAVTVLLGKDVRTVLNASSFRDSSGSMMSILKSHNDALLGPKAITSLMGKEWKYYRSAVHRSFTPAALRESQDVINEVGTTLSKSLLTAIEKNEEEIYRSRVLPLMKMATIDVFGLSALGVDLESCSQLKPSPVAVAFDFLTDEYTRRIQRPWDPPSFMYNIPTAANRRHTKERNVLRLFIAKLVAKGRKDLAEGRKTKKTEFLTGLLQAANDDTQGMSEDALADVLMTLLFAGYDTTSITLTYALYLLATHPEKEEQVISEIQAVMGNGGKVDDPEDLPYTRAVILETLRLYPAAPLTTRNLEKPLELHGKDIPTNTMMYVPIWSIQRDERNYPKPEEFWPERWVKKADSKWVERFENEEKDDNTDGVPPANRDAFCAFSGGARNCVGRVLAMQEAVTILACLLRDLKFEFCEPGYIIKPRLSSFIQKPHDGLPMVIKPRK